MQHNAYETDTLRLFKPLEMPRNPHSNPLVTCATAEQIAEYVNLERGKLLGRILESKQTRIALLGRPPEGGVEISLAFSDLMDAAITRMFALACVEGGASVATIPIAIVATGGYGRRELAPFSDIDITFVPQRDGDPQFDRVIRAMFSLLMDVCIGRCGLEVGYAYRALDDEGSLDHQTITSLLDARIVTGSNRIFIQFEDAFWSRFNAPEFIFTKLREREDVLRKWGTTPRVVEPQIKEGGGGLRDIQTAVWLVQARSHLPAARARGRRAFELVREEADLPRQEVDRLEQAKERLFQVRNALHALTNTKRDSLVRTRQEEVAVCLGYQPRTAPSRSRHSDWKPGPARTVEGGRQGNEFSGVIPAVEQLMADLYPAMALTRRISEMVTRRVRNRRLILGIGLDCKRGAIVPANRALDSDDPTWLLWACELLQKYGLTLGRRTEQAMVALLEVNPVLSSPLQGTQVFTDILSRRERLYSTLKIMADTGVLGWILPEFGAILDLIPYDPSHDHTVGEHSLLLVKHLEELGQGVGGEEMVDMRAVWQGLAHPEQLVLAALLHDSGKAYPGRPHAEVSEEIVTEVCRRLNWSSEATANVAFLCLQHLLMAETSRLRDLSMEETIQAFTGVVDDQERLNMLYLLTYADTKSVGEGIWTQVKGRFLRELWQRANARLEDSEHAISEEMLIDRARQRLLKDLNLENLPEEEVGEHIESMPASYLLNQSMKEIALHIALVRHAREGQPVAEFRNKTEETYTELTVCAFDDPKPGLLAKIAGVLYASDVNIHSAQVNTRISRQDRIALDTLWVDFRGRPLTPGKQNEIAMNLRSVLTGDRGIDEITARRRNITRSRTSEKAEITDPFTVVSVRNDLTESYSVIETIAPDTPGGFYWIADALSQLGWNIASARVSSWRHRARAVFYVTGAREIGEAEAQSRLNALLANAPQTGEKLLSPRERH